MSVCRAVKEMMYMDDFLGSAASVEEAVKQTVVVKKVLAAADLKLQGWVSNSSRLLHEVADPMTTDNRTPTLNPPKPLVSLCIDC